MHAAMRDARVGCLDAYATAALQGDPPPLASPLPLLQLALLLLLLSVPHPPPQRLERLVSEEPVCPARKRSRQVRRMVKVGPPSDQADEVDEEEGGGGEADRNGEEGKEDERHRGTGE